MDIITRYNEQANHEFSQIYERVHVFNSANHFGVSCIYHNCRLGSLLTIRFDHISSSNPFAFGFHFNYNKQICAQQHNEAKIGVIASVRFKLSSCSILATIRIVCNLYKNIVYSDNSRVPDLFTQFNVGFCVCTCNCSFRCRTLFYLHNVRAIVQLILLLTNIFELAEAYLALGITISENISISPLQLTFAWMSFITTVGVIAFTRICEIFDKSGEHRVKDKSSILFRCIR